MAARLVAAGHEVRGFDVRDSAVDALQALGGIACASAGDAAAGADLLWLMVVNGEQADSVLFSGREGGAAAALPAGALIVAACTQAPAGARRLAERAAAIGVTLLDAPVSGGVAGASAGTLSVMCAGPDAAVARAMPVFQAVARHIFCVGAEPGMGSTAKMINQLLCGVHIAAAAEALNVAERAGLSLDTVQRDHQGLGRLQLDVGRSRAAHAAGRTRRDQRGGHLRQGSGHRARPGQAGAPGAAARRRGDADVPGRLAGWATAAPTTARSSARTAR